MEDTAIAVKEAKVEPPKWGVEHPLRGASYNELALSFSRLFPVGSTLTPTDFDTWAVGVGAYSHSVPTPGKRKGADGNSSDRWMAHLQRRFQLRANINKAGSHTRITSHGSRSFVIDQTAHQTLEVRAPEVALAHNNMTDRLTSLCVHKRKNLGYLMQSADWEALPPHERTVAETLFDDIDMFISDINNKALWLNNKFVKLEMKIKRALQDGSVKSRNGGFDRLLSEAPPKENE